MSANIIFIATNSIDISVEKVVSTLESWDYQVVLYESDKVSAGITPLTFSYKDGYAVFYYNSERIAVDSIGAAWLRRPNMFSMPGAQNDAGFKLSMDIERKTLQESLWGAIPDQRWLNPRQAAGRLTPKLLQLRKAADFGFTTPRTVMSNSWIDIQAALAGCEEVVFKMPKGFLYKKDVPYSVHSRIFKNTTAGLPLHSLPFPGIWQEYVPKKREWRITVVGDQVFSAAIYSTDKARDDWRKHQRGPEVTFRTETPPRKLQEKCIDFLRQHGLRYGAFDFIETPVNQFYFLEVNVNGQFMWLEDSLGLPISGAIAAELRAICDKI